MRILIAIPCQDRATGNWVTGCRFQRGLERHGHVLSLYETAPDPGGLEQAVAAFAPELVILLHAYRAGRPWLEVAKRYPRPFMVVLTGTDVHHGMADPEQGPLIDEVLRGASAVVTQNRLTAETLPRIRPDLAPRLHCLPPGIELGTVPYALRQIHAIPDDTFLFFCPASIRPVKGVLELLVLFDALAQRREDFHIACCGPVLDADYGRDFLAAVGERPWASYLGTIPAEAMPAAMRQAEVIVNNSVSEGLPNALLEAIALGRAVLARDIPGNAAIIEQGVNGLLYTDATGFLAAAERLIGDPEYLARMSRPAPESYLPLHEALELDRLCRTCLNQPV
jgi:glycosyltransferase involved in cell wall biosynthesis